MVPVAGWAAWPPTPSSGTEIPDVRFIDASLRRRLGPLGRMMLHVARECAGEAGDLRLVFASTHGELGYTIVLLRALAAGEPLSPTLFSLSVHNAAAGLLSTARGDPAESTAIAAGEETLGQALVEAFAQLAEAPQRPVLLVYGDAPLPEVYRPFARPTDVAQAQGRAVALMLASGASRRMAIASRPASGASASSEPQVESFVRHLAEGAPGTWTGRCRAWSWD